MMVGFELSMFNPSAGISSLTLWLYRRHLFADAYCKLGRTHRYYANVANLMYILGHVM